MSDESHFLEIHDSMERLESVISHGALGIVAAVILLLQIEILNTVAPETVSEMADIIRIATYGVVVYTLAPYLVAILDTGAEYIARWYYGSDPA